MAKNYSDIVIALAGICQSVQLVQQLAYQGQADLKSEKVMLESLLEMNPNTTLDVYGNDLDHLRLGFETISGMLNSSRNAQMTELIGYVGSVMSLERRLNKSAAMQTTLGQKFLDIQRQMDFFEQDSEQLYHAFAGIYVDVISPLGKKIQVHGSPQILQNSLVQAKIRTLLLSGVRAAVLWQQLGGNRWQILFSHKKLVKIARTFLGYTH